MKANKLSLIFLVFLIQITAASAVPVIEYFNVQFTYPAQVQLNWKVTDSEELSKIEIYRDSKLIYDEDITGTKHISLYQVKDDGAKHFFELKAYNVDGGVASELKQGGGDKVAPNVTSPGKVYSNVKELNFKTTEPSICKSGLTQTSLVNLSTDYQVNHTAKLSFNEGTNKVYIKCSDDAGNIMPKFAVIEFNLDSIKPENPGNFSYAVNNNQIRLSWNAVQDTSGIDHYVVYNSLKQIATANSNNWDVNTNDSIYFVSAVDKAGNEGEKAEYGLKRDLLLKSALNPAAEEKKEINNSAKEVNGVSTTSIISWTAFAVLVLVLIVWKIFEHKSDKHGLGKYLTHRRKRGL